MNVRDWLLGGSKVIVGERYNFVIDVQRNFQPMKLFENRSFVVAFGSFGDCAIKSILDCLQALHLRKTCCRKRYYSRQAWNGEPEVANVHAVL